MVFGGWVCDALIGAGVSRRAAPSPSSRRARARDPNKSTTHRQRVERDGLELRVGEEVLVVIVAVVAVVVVVAVGSGTTAAAAALPRCSGRELGADAGAVVLVEDDPQEAVEPRRPREAAAAAAGGGGGRRAFIAGDLRHRSSRACGRRRASASLASLGAVDRSSGYSDAISMSHLISRERLARDFGPLLW